MVKCPVCGADVKPAKTWQLVAPLPDAEGRITITVMGSFKCPNCGYSWRGRVSTLKVGPEGEVEVVEGRKGRKRGGRRKKRAKEEGGGSSTQGQVIEVDLSDIYEEEGINAP